MTQETNLNVSPYFDDFNSDKDFYKVLFKPGFPVQARELNTLQSILQYQTEQHGKHIFKEGSVVIPGELKYENPLYAVQVESEYNGSQISLYFDELIGKKIRGQTSNILAEVVFLLKSSESEKGNYTIYVKYITSGGSDFTQKVFNNGETLLLESPLTYGNFTIQSGQGFCNTLFDNAIYEGTAVSVSSGVYFVRGFFANVESQRILLDQYGVFPSYKVGFSVEETIITSYEDDTLYDNAQGFSNFAAPGSDRFKLKLVLDKRSINSIENDNFVEIMRVENGIPQFFNKNTQYSLIRDELARRTFDESGDYYVKPFSLSVRDSLNDRTFNNGIYFENQITKNGNIPSEDLMVYQISSGKAYVKGYDVETISPRTLDVNKTRTTETLNDQVISYNSGSLAIVHNVFGSILPGIGTDSVVSLMDQRSSGIESSTTISGGSTIGYARVYDFIPESDYEDQTSNFFLRLFDIQTFSDIVLTTPITLTTPTVIKGKRSNASGYLRDNVSSSSTVSLYNVSGEFLDNEPIIINGIDEGRLIKETIDYSIRDIKSIRSQSGISTFNVDLVLDQKYYISPPGTLFTITQRTSPTGISTISAGLENVFRDQVKVGDIVSYSNGTSGLSVYNRVSAVSVGATYFEVESLPSIDGICDGSLPSSDIVVSNVVRLQSSLSSTNQTLLTKLPIRNVSDLNFSDNEILQRRSFTVNSFSNYTITVDIPAEDKDIYFTSFDEDRYVISYSDGSLENIRRDKFYLDPTYNGKRVEFNGLSKELGQAELIATVSNLNASSKVKKLNKTSSIIINKSKYSGSGIGTTSFGDGLEFSKSYGTRIQDEEICLNVPDVVRVLAIYESIDDRDPVLPNLQLGSFSGPSNNTSDYKVGEIIVGKTTGASGIITKILSTNSIEYVNINSFSFSKNEIILGKTSNIESIINEVDPSIASKNITDNYILDNGQRDTFYDYSRIIRKQVSSEPTRKIKVIFQNYTIDSSDTGEFITANSYNSENYKNDVPKYAGIRLTDYIDIRPRVAAYTDTTKSPFEFNSRNFAEDGQYSEYILAPDENLILNYSFYVGRIDTVILNPDGTFKNLEGIPSLNPKPPTLNDGAFDIATIYIPPYVFNINDVKVDILEHKRYRMSDISLLENRIKRVEEYTTLSLLELKTETLKIRDAETGLDRFKSGFFVDNFTDNSYSDILNLNYRSRIIPNEESLTCLQNIESIDLEIGSEALPSFTSIYNSNVDKSYITDLGSTGIRKTGDLITLDYSEVTYFEQPYATKTESVTPFLVRYWQGFIDLNPPSDTWTETDVVTRTPIIDIETFTTEFTSDQNQSGTFRTITGTTTSAPVVTGVTTTGIELLRSRNIEYDVKGLKPVTRFYPFFENINIADYIIPKLLEITMISGSFTIGERIISDPLSSQRRISFRLCKPNHRTGPFDGSNPPSITRSIPVINLLTGVTNISSVSNPDVYTINPYTAQPIEDNYTESSTLLNVDTRALELPSETLYSGFVNVGMRLVGTESGAVCEISNIRLVSDNSGRLIGSLFVPDPRTVGNPTWINGENTFSVVDTPNLNDLNRVYDEFIANSRVTESAAEEEFTSNANLITTELTITTTRNITVTNRQFVPPPPPPAPPPAVNTPDPVNVRVFNREEFERENVARRQREDQINAAIGRGEITDRTQWNGVDPLAQSFYVNEENGIFLTSCDIFFETKDDDIPVIIQIRPMIAGVPSDIVVPFGEVVLNPPNVNTSLDGSIPTRVIFPSPVYLNGPSNLNIRNAAVGSNLTSQYAVVILSNSPNYRVFTTELGQDDILTGVKVSQQYTLGSLFKSQNGTTWSPAQLEDLKYTLYRADFVAEGLTRFFNPELSVTNNLVTVSDRNQFTPLSKRLILSVSSDTYDQDLIVPGVTIVQGSATGSLIGIAGSITIGTGSSVVNSGVGYTPSDATYVYSDISLESETGYGQGAIADITVTNGEIVDISITDGGYGYQIGDSLIIPESQSNLNVGFGGKAVVETLQSKNTFILDNVQGNYSVGIQTVSYINSSGITTSIGGGIVVSSISQDQYYDGVHAKILQNNHGMHSSENYVKISNFKPAITDQYQVLLEDLNVTSTAIPVQDSSLFQYFEGYEVTPISPGYINIGDEVMEYNSISGNTLTISEREVDGTLAIPYLTGSRIYKYEYNGISLRRINKVHNLSEVNKSIHKTDLNNYHIKIDMSDTDFENTTIGKDLSSSGRYFLSTLQSGNSGTEISRNIQFEKLKTNIANIIPAFTNIQSRIRTFTGQSIGGSENSFEDFGFENITLNEEITFSSPRLICSRVNEERLIENTPGNRSFELDCILTTEDSRVSPVIDTVQTSIVLHTNLINNPNGILNNSNYSEDDNVRSLYNDEHAAIYVSKPVKLAIPANSLNIILSAKRNNLNDVRVLYRLFRNDSSEISSHYELFPGYTNYVIDGQGIKRIIDKSQNNGLQDNKVLETSEYEFRDYEYSVDNLPDFDGFSIKIVMASENQATPPVIKELRTIATVKPQI